ncbi:hypothetical protein LIER_07152 [Lithospermum erythrorhizon]|uniref:Uncharacterized protein n=1 Tax=Lithospermum erythrorhizon TaxID=34254 RepID=A0AAV3PBS8_LITER
MDNHSIASAHGYTCTPGHSDVALGTLLGCTWSSSDRIWSRPNTPIRKAALSDVSSSCSTMLKHEAKLSSGRSSISSEAGLPNLSKTDFL